MRIDHVAYRVADRDAAADFFCEAFDYRIQTEFPLNFKDGSTAQCKALEPPEKQLSRNPPPWTHLLFGDEPFMEQKDGKDQYSGHDIEYHMAPEIFVSDGTPDSIVGKWVAARGGIGGIHHIAYNVDSVEETMKKWKEKGWVEFATPDPIKCDKDEMIQVFTKPTITGVIYEFIERGEFGFCEGNVKQLMESTTEFE